MLDDVDHRRWDLLLEVDGALLVDVEQLLGTVRFLILEASQSLRVLAALVLLNRILDHDLLADDSLVLVRP